MVIDKIKKGKELLKMRSQAKDLQKKLSQITASVSKGEYHVKVRADQTVEYVAIGGEESEKLRDAINEAFKEVQKKATKKMVEEGGLGSLLGNLNQ